MRVEATVPDSRATVLAELADELGASRSQLIDEALSLFFKAVLEARRGRRLVSVGGSEPECQVLTPTLAQFEWTAHRQALALPEAAMERIAALVKTPPAPTEALKKAMRRS